MSTEILQIAEAVAREKDLDRDSILKALTESIQGAAYRKYGHKQSVRAEINRKTGDINLFREIYVVEKHDDEVPEEIAEKHRGINKLTVELAQKKHPNAVVGDIVSEPLPPLDRERIVAQVAKQVLVHEVRSAERQKQYDEFSGRAGEIVSGVVEKIEYGNVIVKIGSAEAVLRREHTIRSDRFKNGDRIRALLLSLNPENRGPQLILSRTDSKFLAKLFAQEVPEIYSNIIEVKAVARDPGFRAKIAVYSMDASIDAVGSCVGIRGSRVQAVINELSGEKIDIVPWSSDPATLVVNAIAPAEARKVIIDEDRRRIEVVVPDEQLSIAIGRGGQNVRLASELVGWDLDVMTESDESRRRVEDFNNLTNKFVTALDLEEILAQLLVSEGYSKISEIAQSSIAHIMQIEGLDESIAEELINRAQNYLQSHHEEVIENKYAASQENSRSHNLGQSANERELQSIGVNRALVSRLKEHDITNLREFADLSYDDFMDIIPDSGLARPRIERMIMSARKIVYFSGDNNAQ